MDEMYRRYHERENSEPVRFYKASMQLRERLPAHKERVIATDPECAAKYAIEVIRKRWTRAERAILQHPGWAFFYLKAFIGKRWPRLEKALLDDMYREMPYYDGPTFKRDTNDPERPNGRIVANYAKHVIGGRWLALEKSLLSRFEYLFGGKDHEAITKEPESFWMAHTIHQYTMAVGRWPQGEKIIILLGYYANEYAKHVIGGRWPELERSILEKYDYQYLQWRDYHREVICMNGYKRWPEAEKLIRFHVGNWRAAPYARDYCKANGIPSD